MAVFKDDFTIITTKEPRADESTPSASPTLSGFEDQLTSQGDLSALSSLRLSLKVESRSCSTQRLSRMAGPPSLKGRLTAMLLGIAGILKLFLIYLLSELLIWGCSRPLAFLNAPFFASIVAMVFLGMTVTTTASFSPTIGSLYDKYVKSDVNLINSNLGVGFPIPLVMLDQNSMLSSLTIGRIIGAFVLTNLVWWPLTFVASFGAVSAGYFIVSRPISRPAASSTPQSATEIPLRHMNGPSNQQPTDFSENDKIQNLSPSVSRRGFIDHESLRSPTWTASIWQFLTNYYPLVVSITCALIIGAPVAAATNDPRILDGCMLWFIWYSTVKAQLWLKNNTRWNVDPRLKRISVTMLNPVLMTTLLTLAYTRLRTLALSANLTDILRNFSRGTPLYAIWTSSVTGSELPRNPDHFFGAGDLALSLLECGLVIWGFKLYECRRQLFSFAGLLTAILSIGVAAGNVFFSAVIAHGLGLAQSEALAFSARSTTLALAKPAIDAVHGNLAVNAALVVSNGILGQLMYAYVLPALKAESDDTEPNASATPTSTDINAVEAQHGSQTQPAQMKRYDTPATIATGIAVGINGAAMGVAYLYENKSRAAPYAALSMTVFGVFTVLFITVEPMKSVLIAITA